MKVQVTQKHIDKGVPGDLKFCPITLALTEQTGGVWFVDKVEAGELKKVAGAAVYSPIHDTRHMGFFGDKNELLGARKWAIEYPYKASMRPHAQKRRKLFTDHNHSQEEIRETKKGENDENSCSHRHRAGPQQEPQNLPGGWL